MINRFVNLFLTFFSVIVIALISIQPVHSQNATTGIQGGVLCPENEFTTPVLVTGLQDIDSISLVLKFPAGTLTYIGYLNPNPQLVTGFSSITSTDTSVFFTWHSEAPISITNGKLLDLEFMAGTEPGLLTWDTTSCYYHSATGDTIELALTGDAITFHTAITVEIEEINQTCEDKCEANIVVIAGGGLAPFQYMWNGEQMVVNLDNAVKQNACGGNNIVMITDANGCVLDTIYDVSELPAIQLEIETFPDTVYMQNPLVKFSFTEDQSIVEWLWDFGDGSQKSIERSPVHLYPSAKSVFENETIPDKYIVTLIATNDQGCSNEFALEIPVAEVQIFIPNVFTPPTDPNGYFRIAKKNDGSSSSNEYIPIVYEYQRMELFVLDRWGRKVFESSNYKNDWDGGNLPDGTYFYRLNTFGYFQDKSYTGAVTIIREK
jgi:hypothetical protein